MNQRTVIHKNDRNVHVSYKMHISMCLHMNMHVYGNQQLRLALIVRNNLIPVKVNSTEGKMIDFQHSMFFLAGGANLIKQEGGAGRSNSWELNMSNVNTAMEH